MVQTTLPHRGTLWTWTTQNYPPKASPYAGGSQFEPFALGFVDLGNDLAIETRLVGCDPDQFAIGMEMEFTVVPFTSDAAGNELLTYAFAAIA
jgi:uncharacterized OB-fold protein